MLQIGLSQQPLAKAEGLGFKGPRGQVKGPDKHFLEPLASGILESFGIPTIKLKSSPLPAEASAQAGKGEDFSLIPRVRQ